MPPKVEEVHDAVYLDGIYLARNLCVLICCNDTHVLGWYVCRYEHVTGVQRSFFRKKTKSGLLVVLYALTRPLSVTDILNYMPTDESIAAIYKRLSEHYKVDRSIYYIIVNFLGYLLDSHK